MTLTERLTKINATRTRLRANIDRRASRRQSISYEHARLVRETTMAIKTEMKLQKKGIA